MHLPPLLPRIADYARYHAERTPDAEAMADARTVTVQVHGGGKRNSVFHVPFAEFEPDGAVGKRCP